MPRRRVPARSRVLGFTLIEVMIAIVLVGIFAGLAIPGYQSYRNKANQRLTAQQIATMQVRIKSFYDDNNTYPASLAAAGLGDMKDAWGRPYQYYNIAQNNIGGARKDKNLNPINTDYDLYSKGPDGVTQSQLDNRDSVDDVVRARNGAFIGVSADF